jgi:hypothetical protein
MKRCKNKKHVMKARNIPREWVRDDGTKVFKIYVQVFCDTCKKEREKLNKEYRDTKRYQAYQIQKERKELREGKFARI